MLAGLSAATVFTEKTVGVAPAGGATLGVGLVAAGLQSCVERIGGWEAIGYGGKICAIRAGETVTESWARVSSLS
jgi:hypothetical protein